MGSFETCAVEATPSTRRSKRGCMCVAAYVRHEHHGVMDNSNQRQVAANRLLDEGVMTVVKAAEMEGIRISSKTALRWCMRGVHGVRLESVKIGGRRLTSRAALRRFIAATQEQSVPPLPTTAPTPPPAAVLDAAAAERILRASGLGRDQLRR
jgi:hypothetical protein